ncbi:hypothetical protein ABFX02_06G060600 [Erythranthe guttata]
MVVATAPLVCSKVTAFSSTLSPSSYLVSLRPSNKQFQCKHLSAKNSPSKNNSRLIRTFSNSTHSILSSFSPIPPSNSRITLPLRPLKCSYSNPTIPADANSPKPLLKRLEDLSFESLKSTLLQLTPIDICKWCLVLSVAIAASKQAVSSLFNPFFWLYFSWTWLFWPWIVAIALAIYGIFSLTKHLNGEAKLHEQLAIITSSFTWLTLVPPAHFNGFLEGWPFVFFFIYHYFFFLNVTVRKRMYGDYNPRAHDPKWDISSPGWHKILFCAGIFLGHWLAAFEGTELHLVPGGWANVGIWALILVTVFMQYHSTLYLAKYSENVVVPTAVVQFGPYRFVRHPIYASTMLLFVTYFAALRAPFSLLFIVGVCSAYYGQKAKMEEALMLESFGERYSEYMSKVRYKLIPFVY